MSTFGRFELFKSLNNPPDVWSLSNNKAAFRQAQISMVGIAVVGQLQSSACESRLQRNLVFLNGISAVDNDELARNIARVATSLSLTHPCRSLSLTVLIVSTHPGSDTPPLAESLEAIVLWGA